MQYLFPAPAGGMARAILAATAVAALLAFSAPAQAQSTAFTRALAEAASQNDATAAFYRARAYAPLWSGPGDADRRQALITTLSAAAEQGLPVARYDVPGLIGLAQTAVTEGDRGRFEMAMTQAFLDYARDLTSGALVPKKIDEGIVREIRQIPAETLLAGMAATATPVTYLRSLAPRAPEYARLVKEKLLLEQDQASAIRIAAAKLEPGATGAGVVALRERLIQLGYLGRSATASYDSKIQRAVQRFQLDQGLPVDGVAGTTTIAALNRSGQDNWQSVVVALERLRWIQDADRDGRYIWVNLPSFVVQIIDGGRETFQTRAVVGKNVADQRTPEFSDQMAYMAINPSWGVPRSIIVKEYLPLLQRNSNAVSHLQVVDRSGRVVPRGAVNFAAYSASSFPFGLRQPPSDGNALGKVKFMFPNKHNIYLHDTPAKSLFANEIRAYSHGCIRLNDPMDFAYALLSRQTADPKGVFQTHLDTKRETNVNLEQKVPVHLVYFTAWPTDQGRISYLRDIYGRDALLYEALQKAGVVQPQVQG